MSSRMRSRRAALLREVERWARRALFGTLSETSRTCGQPGCRCHHGGPKALAKVLGSKQALVSKLERRADMYVSSLRSYIEALGGELDIIARFRDGSVRITQFQDIDPGRRSA